MFAKDPAIADRLAEVRKHNRRMYYARLIHRGVMRWFKVVHQKNMIKRAMAEAKRKALEEDRKNADDDNWRTDPIVWAGASL